MGIEVAKNKFLAQMAVGIGNGDKSWSRSITNMWKQYLRASYYMEAEFEETEKNMVEEYNLFKHLRPKVTINKEGNISLSGIPK